MVKSRLAGRECNYSAWHSTRLSCDAGKIRLIQSLRSPYCGISLAMRLVRPCPQTETLRMDFHFNGATEKLRSCRVMSDVNAMMILENCRMKFLFWLGGDRVLSLKLAHMARPQQLCGRVTAQTDVVR
jgi:hypothetical protein